MTDPVNGNAFTEVEDPAVRDAIESGARSGRLTPFNAALLEGKMLFVEDAVDFKAPNGQSQTFTSRGMKMRTRTADGGRYFWLTSTAPLDGSPDPNDADIPPDAYDAAVGA